MTREELDFIGSMNMCDEISNEAYKKIVCHCGEQELCEDAISKTDIVELLRRGRTYAFHHPEQYKTEREADIVDTLYVNLIQAVDKLPPVNPQAICEEREKGECPYYAG